jgi:hypothetical protein
MSDWRKITNKSDWRKRANKSDWRKTTYFRESSDLEFRQPQS